MSNGDLLRAARADGFDVLVTADRSIRYQQSGEKGKAAAVTFRHKPRHAATDTAAGTFSPKWKAPSGN